MGCHRLCAWQGVRVPLGLCPPLPRRQGRVIELGCRTLCLPRRQGPAAGQSSIVLTRYWGSAFPREKEVMIFKRLVRSRGRAAQVSSDEKGSGQL